ncbi:hypothetical protein LZ30DRAFT_683557 [Colletotrichum cereale]|nr:hypothetical protein LZ30DRAFT_683557 [Colletotrichum cereale]
MASKLSNGTIVGHQRQSNIPSARPCRNWMLGWPSGPRTVPPRLRPNDGGRASPHGILSRQPVVRTAGSPKSAAGDYSNTTAPYIPQYVPTHEGLSSPVSILVQDAPLVTAPSQYKVRKAAWNAGLLSHRDSNHQGKGKHGKYPDPWYKDLADPSSTIRAKARLANLLEVVPDWLCGHCQTNRVSLNSNPLCAFLTPALTDELVRSTTQVSLGRAWQSRPAVRW